MESSCCSHLWPHLALLFSYPLWASPSKQHSVPWTCCLLFGTFPISFFCHCAWPWQNALLAQFFIRSIINTLAMGRMRFWSWADDLLQPIVCGWKWWCLNLQGPCRFPLVLLCFWITMSRFLPDPCCAFSLGPRISPCRAALRPNLSKVERPAGSIT